jgi:uncharacterized membrane protein YdjX (TVP38/TMEM64 family)
MGNTRASSDPAPPVTRGRTGNCARAVVIGFGVAVLVALGSTLEIAAVQTWVAEQGPLAPVVFILIGAILSLLCVPLDVICIVGGVLFDFAAGLVCVTVANYLGQCLAYLVARVMLRESLGRFLSVRPRLKLVERAIAARGAFLLFLIRLAPIPAAPTSYLVGATRMPFSSFAVANLGLVPVSFLSLSISRSLLTAGEGSGMNVWVLVGIAMAAIALVYATIVVKRSLLAVSTPTA